MSIKHGLILLALALPVAPHVAAADAESEAALHYPLTMARIEASYRAQLAMIKAAERHPALGDAIETDADEPAAKTIARLRSTPELKTAIHDAGLTTKTYVYISLAYAGAALGAVYKQNMHGKLDQAYDAANVAFLQAHQKELQVLQADFQKQAQMLSGDSDAP